MRRVTKDAANLLIGKKTFSQAKAGHCSELLKSMNVDATLLRLLSKYVDQDTAVKTLSSCTR